jgi:hypothetical protein
LPIFSAVSPEVLNNRQQIKEFESTSVIEYSSNWKTQRIVEKTLQMIIESCVDVAGHIISDQGFRIPKSYSDTFTVLHENGILVDRLLLSLKKMDVQEIRNRLHQELPRLRQEYSVRSLGLFGSYVRGENRKGSDLDVMVEFFKVPGMLRFLDLERDLAAILGVKVDLVQKEVLKPSIGKRILEEVLPV